MRGLFGSGGPGAHPLVLDGGLATQLEADGADLSGKLWSARLLKDDPDKIQRAHEAFLLAGCNIITTASYQCSIPLLSQVLCIQESAAEDLIVESVRIARRAVLACGSDSTIVAASIGPFGACLADGSEYNGHYKDMPVEKLMEWHRRRFELLTDSGADVLAFETIPCHNEVVALCRLLREKPDVRAWISMACGSATALNSGENIVDVVADLKRQGLLSQVEAVGINCTPPQYATSLLTAIQATCNLPLIVYANSGEVWDAETRGWNQASESSQKFESHLTDWIGLCQVVGGCCRVGPSTIAEIQHLSSPTASDHQKSIPLDVILDVDTGIDDALALLLAIRSKDLNVVGVTTVAGNSNVDIVTEATLKVLDAAGAAADLAVSKGAAEPLKEPSHFCPHIHGHDSLGDLRDPILPPSS